MSQQLFIAFVVFAAGMFFTPGPDNGMLLSSGRRRRNRRSWLTNPLNKASSAAISCHQVRRPDHSERADRDAK